MSLFENEIGVIQKMVNLLQAANAGLEKERAAANIVITQLEAANAGLEALANKSRTKIALLETANANLESQITTSNASIVRLEAGNTVLRAKSIAFETEILRLQRQNDYFRRMKDDLIITNSKLTRENIDRKREETKLVVATSRIAEAFDLIQLEASLLRDQISELRQTVDTQAYVIQHYRDQHDSDWEQENDEGEEDPDAYVENLAILPDFSVGYVGGETWGTDYSLEDQFQIENEGLSLGVFGGKGGAGPFVEPHVFRRWSRARRDISHKLGFNDYEMCKGCPLFCLWPRIVYELHRNAMISPLSYVPNQQNLLADSKSPAEDVTGIDPQGSLLR